MLNNKGQSLVLFVISIPIFLILFIVVSDIGKMILMRNELDNINYLALDYGIKYINDDDVIDKVNNFIIKNDSDIRIVSSKIVDGKINIETTKEYKGNFIGFILNGGFKIRSKYVGYFLEGKKKIERVK